MPNSLFEINNNLDYIMLCFYTKIKKVESMCCGIALIRIYGCMGGKAWGCYCIICSRKEKLVERTSWRRSITFFSWSVMGWSMMCEKVTVKSNSSKDPHCSKDHISEMTLASNCVSKKSPAQNNYFHTLLLTSKKQITMQEWNMKS